MNPSLVMIMVSAIGYETPQFGYLDLEIRTTRGLISRLLPCMSQRKSPNTTAVKLTINSIPFVFLALPL